MTDWLSARAAELGLAFGLLTRLPVGWLLRAGPATDPGRAVWAYPLVGWVVGAIGAAAVGGGRALGLPLPVASVVGLAAMVLATGALHEDGLADTVDGFGGGASRARKLEIMRDSRIGSYGVVALILSLGLRGAAMEAVPAVGVVAAAVLGRTAMVGALLMLRPARADGLSAGLHGLTVARSLLAIALGLESALVLSPAGTALWAILASVAAALAVSWLAARQIGGHTGDVCGAAEQVAEALALVVMAAGR